MKLVHPLSDAQNRAENYAAKSESFQTHSKKMAETANSLARSGVVTDRQLADDLIRTSKKVGLHACTRTRTHTHTLAWR